MRRTSGQALGNHGLHRVHQLPLRGFASNSTTAAPAPLVNLRRNTGGLLCRASRGVRRRRPKRAGAAALMARRKISRRDFRIQPGVGRGHRPTPGKRTKQKSTLPGLNPFAQAMIQPLQDSSRPHQFTQRRRKLVPRQLRPRSSLAGRRRTSAFDVQGSKNHASYAQHETNVILLRLDQSH